MLLVALLFLLTPSVVFATGDAAFVDQLRQIGERVGASRETTKKPVSEERAFLQAARSVADRISPEPGDVSSLFTPEFLSKPNVSTNEVRELLSSFYRRSGSVVSIEPIRRTGLQGSVRFHYSKGASQRVDLRLRSVGDPRLDGLMFHPAAGPWKSAKDVMAAFSRLPGKTALQLSSIDEDKLLLSKDPEQAVALGSAFKLYILQLLAEKGLWDAPVTIQDDLKSWPSGVMQDLPAGTTLPALAYARKMISISDNTATDHLHHLVGRADLEASLARLGNRHASANAPFLSTHEIFWIKTHPDETRRWLGLDVGGRRAMLKEREGVPLGAPPEHFDWRLPIAVEQIEWFASPGDMCRLLATMDRQRVPQVFETLAINPLLDFPEERFTYAGFKGGSEPGVLFFAFLFHSKAGHSYCLAAGQTDASAALDQEGLMEMLQSLLYLAPTEARR